jgi:MazG family protein
MGARTERRRRRGDARVRRAASAFGRVVRLMAILRSDRGCPWDREQTHASLRPFLIEESYEVVEAIDRHDDGALAEELGDVLFQCVFHAQLAAEDGRFEIADAADTIARKLIRRHPHVFDAAGRPISAAEKQRRGLQSPGAVLEQWERLKARETPDTGTRRRVLAGVPRSMPALLRAHEIGTRVASVGFDWPRAGDVVDKIDEEVRELREAVRESPARAAEELGDLLFSIANLARKIGVEPESALRQANDKFTRRFDAVEARLESEGSSVHGSSIDALERAWTAVKTAAPPPRETPDGAPRPSSSPPRGRRSRASPRRRRRS